MGAGFAILRTKRITDINKAFNHNLRVNKEFSRHADHTKTDENMILYDKFSFGLGGGDFESRIDEHIKRKNICEERHKYQMYGVCLNCFS